MRSNKFGYNPCMSFMLQEKWAHLTLNGLTLNNLFMPVDALPTDTGPLLLLDKLKENPTGHPVVEPRTGRLRHFVSEEAVLKTLISSSEHPLTYDQVSALLLPPDGMASLYFVTPESPISEALRLFQETGSSLIPVVDPASLQYQGVCVSRTKLLEVLSSNLTPPRIGGMATPLGVYLHTGVHRAGADWRGLTLMGLAYALVAIVLDYGYMVFWSVSAALFPPLLSAGTMIETLLQLGFFFGGLLTLIRFTPIGGYHAAEHMTINTIEAGLPVAVETVSKSSRVHRRCGTNLMVLLMAIQVVVVSMMTMADALSPTGAFFYGLSWFILIGNTWKYTGSWLQTHFTTTPPNATQLESGVKAGRELLAKFAQAPHGKPTLWQRLWGSGLFQIMGSFTLCYAILMSLIDWLFSGEFRLLLLF
jgi:CBS domain-containing protein